MVFSPLRFLSLSLLFFTVFATGCKSGRTGFLPPGVEGLQVQYGETYSPYFDKLLKKGEREWVLHLNEMAAQAMINGDRELAERALDESILNINHVFGSTSEARRARNLFFNEDVKLFKGDPHERSMAFFYRAILYMQRNDWQNARALLRSAVLQDAFAEESQNRADWVIFDYLISVCEIQLGRPEYAKDPMDISRENYARFLDGFDKVTRTRLPSTPKPIIEKDTNALVIVLEGSGPAKSRAGQYGELLTYQRAEQSPPRARVSLCNEKPELARTMDSLFYQATTRGGRAFDAIQRRKVIFKGTTETIGSIGTNAGAWVLLSSNSSEQSQLGLAMIATGLIFHGVSSLTATKADIRSWRGLPEYLSLYAHNRCPGGEQTVTVQFDPNRVASTTAQLPEPGKGLAVFVAFDRSKASILGPATK